MAKKCPPGMICIQNYTMSILICLLLIFLFFIYINYNKSKNLLQSSLSSSLSSLSSSSSSSSSFTCNNSTQQYNSCDSCSCNSHSLNSINNDILQNPYAAPLKDDRVFNTSNFNKIPINIKTQSINANYRQIGILTRVNGGDTILPLMGKPLIRNRDKWNFYTMNDKNNMIKLPITFKNKNCSSTNGCDNIYNGDTVYVEGYNDVFKATIYENNVLEYIPYL